MEEPILERQLEPEIDAAYFDALEKMPVHYLLAELEKHLPISGFALDLGAGVGNSTNWLLQKGFQVLAIDSSPLAANRLKKRFQKDKNLQIEEADFSKMELPRCDVVIAGFSLFFVSRHRFKAFWRKLEDSLTPSGLIACQFLGKDDEWNNGKRPTHTHRSLLRLLENFEILYLEEVNREGKTILNRAKHWHVFHVIARKKPPEISVV